MTEQWKVICKVSDIPVLGARVVQRGLAWQELPDVAVFRTADDKVFALLDRCPHKGGPLSQGIVFGDKVACPLHNWNIELDSGCATAPDVGCAKRFKVRVEDGKVSLDLNELSAPASKAEAALLGASAAPAQVEAA
ncbi:MAG: nitrite reductase small subunit NirD [Pseudomonadota bacterium]